MRTRIRNLVIEVMIAVAIVALIVFAAYRSPTSDSRVALRWVGLSLWTAFGFGYPLVRFRPYWRHFIFWLSWTVLLAIHLAAYVLVFHRIVVDMGSLLIFVITMAEMQAIVAVLGRAVRFCANSETRLDP